MSPYPRLVQPITAGPISLPNRVVMGSMHLGLEELPGGFERMAAFYAERAAGGVGLIVTGGIAPNEEGAMWAGGAKLSELHEVDEHRIVTDAVQSAGGRIALQILHFGRYADHDRSVAPSELQAPISRHRPRALTGEEIEATIRDYVRTAQLARDAGYDGVEIMGSEGYLINEFTSPSTNLRTDRWGGSAHARHRFPVEIVAAIAQAVGQDLLVMYRLSVLDLVPDGSTHADMLDLARAVERAGAHLLNTGIGWHESRVPTIAMNVPRGLFAGNTRALKDAVNIPVVASNRINTPEVAEQILTDGHADMVSLARPLLADSHFVAKAANGQAREIAPCIACNQACIDHTLSGQVTSCLVNPRACHETQMVLTPTPRPQSVAVVGAGAAGVACALSASQRGFAVTLFDASEAVGGLLNLARRVPGKEEFHELVRYYEQELARSSVQVRLGQEVKVQDLVDAAFDHIVIATGVAPRTPDIEGLDHKSVVGYADVLAGTCDVGERVAILGAGGIGFDVARAITAPTDHVQTPTEFAREWGLDLTHATPGGLVRPEPRLAKRTVTLLQRKTSKLGAGLGKTTGWIHRAELSHRGVRFIAGAVYQRITDSGLEIDVKGKTELIEADTIIVCTGQESRRDLYEQLIDAGRTGYLIGGANLAAELDAKRAIRDGVETAMKL
jgi:2,4-dienoyl-CoA reductase (NADPH2)